MIRHLVSLALLMVLALATTALAFVDLGAGNPIAALGIAAAKATVIGAVFMELLRKNRLDRLAAATGLFFLAILIGLTTWVSI